jgi:hypothetical protein
MFIAPPKTPVASKLRKDAQAKALAAEEVAEANEGELLEDEGNIEEQETKIKNERRTEEEKKEDHRETAVLRAERRERNRPRPEEALLIMEVSDEEQVSIFKLFSQLEKCTSQCSGFSSINI